MASLSNSQIEAFDEADFAGYVDVGLYELEEFVARRTRLQRHIEMSAEDGIED